MNLLEPKDRLSKLQAYYVYDEVPYRFKVAPELNRDLADALKREQLDKRYRFVWGGVVLVRTEENGKDFEIARGTREACEEVTITGHKTELPFTTLMPKYLYVRAKQARGVYYLDDVHGRIDVSRPEFVPPGRIAQVDYRYVDFGVLRWFLERRTTGQELVDARVYDPKEEVPEHEWITLMRLDTKRGRYYEPGLEFISVLKQREYEDRNADLNKVGEALAAQVAASQQDTEDRDDQAAKREYDLMFADVARRLPVSDQKELSIEGV